MTIPVLRRPLGMIALLFFAVTFLLLKTDVDYALPVALISAILLVFLICIHPLRRIRFLRVLMTAILLPALLLYAYHTLQVRPLQEMDGQETAVRIQITALPEQPARSYRAVVLSDTALPRGTKLAVSFAHTVSSPALYSIIEGTARVYLPSGNGQALQSDGIFLMAYFPGDYTVQAGAPSPLQRGLDMVRATIIGGIRDWLPGEEGALLAALLLGDKTALSVSVENAFRSSGLSHILVVSGLHMSILMGTMMTLLRNLRLPGGIKIMLQLGPLWAFMLLVGLSPSVMRAGLMLHIVILSPLLRGRTDTLTALAFALLVIVGISPYAVLDIGFLLSFAATLGIVLCNPLLAAWAERRSLIRRFPRIYTVLQTVCTPIAALIFTAPVSALAFGSVAVLAPISNFLVAWPVTLLLPLAALGSLLLFVPFCNWLVPGLYMVTGLLAKWTIAVAQIIGRVPLAGVRIDHPITFCLLCLVPLALYSGWRLYRGHGLRRMAVLSMALVICCCTILTCISRRTVSIQVIADEDAAVILLQTGGHYMAVIPGADHADFLHTGRVLSQYGITALDILAIPNGNHSTTSLLAELLQSVMVRTVVYAADTGDWTLGIRDIRREPVETNAVFTFWNTGTLSVQQGWWRLKLGDTRLLLASDMAKTETLSEDWRHTHLLVLRENIPEQMDSFTAQQCVVICADETVHAITAGLPWGVYPITCTPARPQLAFLTAGRGDLTPADRYWL